MFDYQAGEKYRLTLVMVALAGLIAGMFFSVILIPSGTPARHRRVPPAWASNADVTGRSSANTDGEGSGAAHAMPETAAPNPSAACQLITQWLPFAWDLSAGEAKGSQEKAMQFMTAECRQRYRNQVWTPELAKQIDDSGLKSSFEADSIRAGTVQEDGSVVVLVDGHQTLSVAGKGETARPVKLEYLVKQTTDGLRIAGISEGGGGL